MQLKLDNTNALASVEQIRQAIEVLKAQAAQMNEEQFRERLAEVHIASEDDEAPFLDELNADPDVEVAYARPIGDVLSEIEDGAKALFLASRGDPAKMAAAYAKAEAAETLRAALQTRLTDERFADQRESRQ